MQKLTALAAAVAVGISSLTLTSSAGASESRDQITNLEAYQQTGMGRFMLGLYGEPQQQGAETQSAALVEEGKAEAFRVRRRSASSPMPTSSRVTPSASAFRKHSRMP
jgi:hypothetical protein